MSSDSTAIALLTVFDPAAAPDLDAVWELRLGEDRYAVRLAGGALDIERGEAREAEAAIATDPGTLAQLLWRGLPIADAEESGGLEITGDRRAAKRFLGLFRA